ncbi:MAG TPA: hypothetical protein VGM30_00515 [Puia sp.]|jgi:hypothetical protein
MLWNLLQRCISAHEAFALPLQIIAGRRKAKIEMQNENGGAKRKWRCKMKMKTQKENGGAKRNGGAKQKWTMGPWRRKKKMETQNETPGRNTRGCTNQSVLTIKPYPMKRQSYTGYRELPDPAIWLLIF